jgi:hypothetical protein
MSEPWDTSAAFALTLAIVIFSVSLPRVVPMSAKATNMATARFLVVTYLRSGMNVDA